MTEHPGDNAETRFRAFWFATLAFVGFGIALLLLLKIFGPDRGNSAAAEPVSSELNQWIVDSRKANLAEVRSAQAALVTSEGLDTAFEKSIAAISAKKPSTSAIVVPNSPTFIKQMEQGQSPAPAGDDAAPAGEDAKKPDAQPAPDTRPAPASDPAANEKKPQAETPAKPAAPAPKPAEPKPAEPAPKN